MLRYWLFGKCFEPTAKTEGWELGSLCLSCFLPERAQKRRWVMLSWRHLTTIGAHSTLIEQLTGIIIDFRVGEGRDNGLVFVATAEEVRFVCISSAIALVHHILECFALRRSFISRLWHLARLKLAKSNRASFQGCIAASSYGGLTSSLIAAKRSHHLPRP